MTDDEAYHEPVRGVQSGRGGVPVNRSAVWQSWPLEEVTADHREKMAEKSREMWQSWPLEEVTAAEARFHLDTSTRGTSLRRGAGRCGPTSRVAANNCGDVMLAAADSPRPHSNQQFGILQRCWMRLVNERT
ncbi:hypothetical protein R5W24_001314 [Gemmata sp. JC717]|uniref:hypothetical protein n=1 Tax=Gemmata algarum TaxID=2975278 RepID=UPI0021BB682A|nr:hypothetical protein [Gemmata algarum]MDY3552234.1 hypothetical protein [Gemmata algarum]